MRLMNTKRSPFGLLMDLILSGVSYVSLKLNWPSYGSSTETITICLLLLALTGTGCQNLVNVKNLDLGFGGLEIEFYEPAPVIVQTNLINLEADIIPKLMQRRRK